MKTVLVTGGAGYIGSHVCKELSHRNIQPVVIDNLCMGHRWAVRWGPLYVADIADSAAIRALIRIYRPAAVVHMAAFAYVGESMNDPGRYWRNNVASTLVLLDTLVAEDVRSLVFSSTCAVYGAPNALPINEETPTNAISPYGRSKLAVESMLKDFGKAHGFREVCLRYFNAAGADPDFEIGELHDPEPHLIPIVLDAAAGARQVVDIFGDDYPTPDGTCIRDYIHVTDLARAHVKAVEYLLNGGVPVTLNLGTGNGASVYEIINATETITGRRIRTRVLPRRSGDPPALVADDTKARRILGFVPQMSNIPKIIDTAWRWRAEADRKYYHSGGHAS